MPQKEKIAVIGSGISSLVTAYFLSDKFDVKIFEQNNYLGGHSNTVDIDYLGKKIAVDTGFIVFNYQTYPNLKAFFEFLDVAHEKSNMSFAVKIDEGSLEYAGTNISTVFAQKKNLFKLDFIKMVFDIVKFNKKALKILEEEFDPKYTLSHLLDDLKLRDYFRQFYLLPMSGAIWSCPLEVMLQYPAQSFVRFFKNHGLLTVADQPQWYTVSGGSKNYVKKIAQKLENISLNDAVLSVENIKNGKILLKSQKGEEIFDKVILGCHGDQAFKILKQASKEQEQVLANFKYQKNEAILHKDISVMPNNKKTWSSWVYAKNSSNKENEISVTYWMNNLQNIDKYYPLFVTLNPNIKIKEEDIFYKITYEHPIFDENAVLAQNKIADIQGLNNIYFCGAYQKYGFHEDGISSAIRVLNLLDVKVPWQK